MSVRPHRRGRRRAAYAALVGLAGAAAVLGIAGPAAAHVTVRPTAVVAGASDQEFTFRVPGERDGVTTVKVQVFLPATPPIPAVSVRPVSGWAVSVDTAALAAPVRTDDGSVDRAVRSVTWQATTGGLSSGQYEDFSVMVGQIPSHTRQLTFKALQTYSDGEVVRWIEVPSSGDPSPDQPAPVVAVRPSTQGTASGGNVSGGTPTAVGAAGLAVASAALVVAAFSLWRRRRPPSDPRHATHVDSDPSGSGVSVP